MNELMRVAIDHHLYILVPLGVALWIWSNWERWANAWHLWRLRRALTRRRAHPAQHAAPATSPVRQERRPGLNEMRDQLEDMEAEQTQLVRNISALKHEQQTSGRRAQRTTARRGRRA
ncbi:MAG: hypothetical protein GEU73_12980 [Chloroflexi bacterium]|nr:hypothetical protein [Chloroflexota bacterium]